MPLSSVLGAQSLVRPGVCTSSTRPASPFEGQLIFETDTNRVVAYDGSNWVYAVDTDQPPGLQLVKTQTIGSAVSSVTVSDVFSSEFDTYEVVLQGGAGSGSIGLNITFGSTATNYYSIYNGRSWAGSAVTGQGSNTTSIVDVGASSTNGHYGKFTVDSPYLSRRTIVSGLNVSPRTDGYALHIAGFLNDANSYTGFTLTTSSGTITGGTIRVYGYRNS